VNTTSTGNALTTASTSRRRAWLSFTKWSARCPERSGARTRRRDASTSRAANTTVKSPSPSRSVSSTKAWMTA
jgi:hypothetical protein